MDGSHRCHEEAKRKLHVESPILLSYPLSRLGNFKVYLKMDNLQPSGSFKIRGMSHMIRKAMEQGICEHVYCASGGNAGMAAAHASQQLGIPCTIVVPSTTAGFVVERLRGIGAEVQVIGNVYDEAKKKAQELSAQPGAFYAPAFEHPDLWEGHSTLILESSQQMDEKPDLVITSVGGGGLLNGIVLGMRNVGWQDVPILGVETEGANCFNAAITAGKVVTLPGITSIATSLGSLTTTATSVDYYKEAEPRIMSCLVTDRQVVNACVRFSEDHRCLVEPACGASLSAIYSNLVPQLQESGKLGKVNSVLVIICGGGGVSTALLEKWKVDFEL